MVKGLALGMRLARAHYTPVILLPVGLGTALAWYGNYALDWINFVVALIGAFFAHLGANVVNDIYDFRTGADEVAESRDSKDFGGSDVLVHGLMTPREAARWAVGVFSLALAACLFLTYRAGWPILGLSVLGFLLAFFYVAPPLRFGYTGRGLGELAIFFAFGPIPVAGAYYLQAGEISGQVILASFPVAFYTTLILYNHHFTHFRGDAQVGKISPVVALGETRAQSLSWVILTLAYLSIVMGVIGGLFPALSLLAIITAPAMYLTLSRLQDSNPLETYMALTGKTAQMNMLTGLLLVASLAVAPFWS